MKESPLTITLPLLMGAYRSPDYPKGIKAGKLADEINKVSPDSNMSQTKIWRFCTAKNSEPKRSSVEPVASFFGLSYNQIYDIEFIERLTSEADLTGAPISELAFEESPLEIVRRLSPSQRKEFMFELMRLELEENSANSDK